jgi:hypothetical protein
MNVRLWPRSLALLFTWVVLLQAAPVQVRHTQGLLRGFLVLRSLDGDILAIGDISQVASGAQVTNDLIFRFKDGSIHQETTVYSQRRVFRLLTYHLVQKGPAFKIPTDLTVNNSTGQVNVRYTDDHGKEQTINERMKLPDDIANGLVTTLLNDISSSVAKTTVSMVATTPKPRLIKLAISPAGEDSFSVAGSSRKATQYVVKVEIGGIGGIVAPIIGRQPPDTHIWMLEGKAPSLLKSEGPLYDGGPIWRIELVSPTWPKNDTNQKR